MPRFAARPLAVRPHVRRATWPALPHLRWALAELGRLALAAAPIGALLLVVWSHR